MIEGKGEIIIYETADLPQIEVRPEDETVWLTQAQIVEVLSSSKANISEHINNEKDDSFRGSLAAIYQTFSGEDLYPSVEGKAANLLYFVIKNHSFSDGNKRIAAFLFVWFLEKNALLYKPDQSRKLADNALVALTLMIAKASRMKRT